MLQQQAATLGDKPWLIFDGTHRVSFAEALESAYRFGNGLRARDRAPGAEHVAILLRNRAEFMTAFPGAHAAGAVSVPLNPELRGPLLRTMLARCRATVIVVSAELADRLDELDDLAEIELVIVCGARSRAPAHDVPTVDFDHWISSQVAEAPPTMPRPHEVACLMFTSGTSGGSKAAIWTHHYLYLGGACVSDSLEHHPDSVLSTPLQTHGLDGPAQHRAGAQAFPRARLHTAAAR